MATPKIVVCIAFGYELSPNPDAAADALWQAGFAVHRFPTHMRHLLAHPNDDHIEAVKAGTEADIDTIWNEAEFIVDGFGGDCHECGGVDDAYVPFEGLGLRELLSMQ